MFAATNWKCVARLAATVVAAATAAAGCARGDRPLRPQAAAEMAVSAAAVARDLLALRAEVEALMSWTGGMAAIVPDADQVWVQDDPDNALLPSFDRALTQWRLNGPTPATVPPDCGTALPRERGWCLTTTTQASTAPGLSGESFVYTVYAPTGQFDGGVVLVGLEGQRRYSDGSTSHVTLLDLEAPTGTSAANVYDHRALLREVRVYDTTPTATVAVGELTLHLHGAPDDDDMPGDGADELFAATSMRRNANGVREWLQVAPATALTGERRFDAATVTRVREGAGDVPATNESFVWDTRAGTAVGIREQRFPSGATALTRIAVAPAQTRVVEWSSAGGRATTTLHGDARTFARAVEWGGAGGLARSASAGSWRVEPGGDVVLALTLVRRGVAGQRAAVAATVTRDAAGRLAATWDRLGADGARDSGTATFVPDDTGAAIAAITRRGKAVVRLEGRGRGDGAATLALTIDDPATSQGPDVAAALALAADGSGSGTVAGRDGAEVRVTIDAAGRLASSVPASN